MRLHGSARKRGRDQLTRCEDAEKIIKTKSKIARTVRWCPSRTKTHSDIKRKRSATKMMTMKTKTMIEAKQAKPSKRDLGRGESYSVVLGNKGNEQLIVAGVRL